MLNAEEIKRHNKTASDIVKELDLPPAYLAEVTKVLNLHTELKEAGYAIVEHDNKQ